MNPPSRFLKEIPKELTEFSSSVFSVNAPRFASNGRFGSSTYGKENSFDEFAQTSYTDDYSQEESVFQVTKSSGYEKGQRVRHPTFGPGSVFATEGAGDNLKISVLFQDNTIKKFVAKYARLERI